MSNNALAHKIQKNPATLKLLLPRALPDYESIQSILDWCEHMRARQTWTRRIELILDVQAQVSWIAIYGACIDAFKAGSIVKAHFEHRQDSRLIQWKIRRG